MKLNRRRTLTLSVRRSEKMKRTIWLSQSQELRRLVCHKIRGNGCWRQEFRRRDCEATKLREARSDRELAPRVAPSHVWRMIEQCIASPGDCRESLQTSRRREHQKAASTTVR